MPNQKFLKPRTRPKADIRRLCMLTPLCLALFLGGCGKEMTIGVPKMPNLFGDPDPRVLRTKGSEPMKKQSTLSKGTSHMDEEEDLFEAPDGIIPVPDDPKKFQSYSGKNIFGKNLRSDSDRLDRLERAVQDMRNDFDAVTPSIRRLIAIEGDIQSLLGELQKLNDNPSLATPTPQPRQAPQPAPMVKKAPIVAPAPVAKKITTKTPPPVSGGKASVYDVRVGEHPGKTRIVMDVNAKTSYSVDIDNSEKIMIIELPNAGWSAAMSKTLAKSPYISSYKVEPSGDGHMMIFQLKKNASVAYKADLAGARGSGRRLVIDISGG